jgi:hypothetical protein
MSIFINESYKIGKIQVKITEVNGAVIAGAPSQQPGCSHLHASLLSH